MKAVLVLDEMPESCEGCPLRHERHDFINNEIIYFCPPSRRERLPDDCLSKRPLWCPLRKLPGRSLYSDITLYNLRNLPDGYEMSTEFKLGCNIGFNAYRDMLLGTNWED